MNSWCHMTSCFSPIQSMPIYVFSSTFQLPATAFRNCTFFCFEIFIRLDNSIHIYMKNLLAYVCFGGLVQNQSILGSLARFLLLGICMKTNSSDRFYHFFFTSGNNNLHGLIQTHHHRWYQESVFYLDLLSDNRICAFPKSITLMHNYMFVRISVWNKICCGFICYL